MHGRKFQMPSKNIACAFYSHALRCDIKSGLKPQPKRKCDLDWTGLAITAHGKASPVCAGDTVADKNAPVLQYGHKYRRQDVVCKSRTDGLRCHNSKGHGFFLSRERWDTW